MPRFLYLYNSDTGEVIESVDVTNASTDERELQKIDLLVKCQFPCDVLESNVIMDAVARPAVNAPIMSDNRRRQGAGRLISADCVGTAT